MGVINPGIPPETVLQPLSVSSITSRADESKGNPRLCHGAGTHGAGFAGTLSQHEATGDTTALGHRIPHSSIPRNIGVDTISSPENGKQNLYVQVLMEKFQLNVNDLLSPRVSGCIFRCPSGSFDI